MNILRSYCNVFFWNLIYHSLYDDKRKTYVYEEICIVLLFCACSFFYRELLWKFFYPADYQDMVPTEEAKPGEFRNYKKFEFMMNLQKETTVDILFTKDSVWFIFFRASTYMLHNMYTTQAITQCPQKQSPQNCQNADTTLYYFWNI